MASTKRYYNKKGELVSIQIRVYRGEDENGKTLKPYQKSVKVPKGSTERQVQKLIQEQSVLFERECREGLASDDGVLFRDFAHEVMELKRVEGIELSTLDRYQDILDKRLIPYFGHMKVRDISGSLLNRFYREMLQPGQNKKTGGSLSENRVGVPPSALHHLRASKKAAHHLAESRRGCYAAKSPQSHADLLPARRACKNQSCL